MLELYRGLFAQLLDDLAAAAADFWWVPLAAWVWTVLVAKLLAFAGLKRIPPNDDMLELIAASGLTRVRVYTKSLYSHRGGGMDVLAYAEWFFGIRAVVIDGHFLGICRRAHLRFVFAHELGHHAHRHPRAGFFHALSGACLFSMVDREREKKEAEADRYAERLTGTTREVLK